MKGYSPMFPDKFLSLPRNIVHEKYLKVSRTFRRQTHKSILQTDIKLCMNLDETKKRCILSS